MGLIRDLFLNGDGDEKKEYSENEKYPVMKLDDFESVPKDLKSEVRFELERFLKNVVDHVNRIEPPSKIASLFSRVRQDVGHVKRGIDWLDDFETAVKKVSSSYKAFCDLETLPEKIKRERELEEARHKEELHKINHGKKMRDLEYKEKALDVSRKEEALNKKPDKEKESKVKEMYKFTGDVVNDVKTLSQGHIELAKVEAELRALGESEETIKRKLEPVYAALNARFRTADRK